MEEIHCLQFNYTYSSYSIRQMRACTFSPDSRVAPGSLKSELRRPGPTLHSCPSAHFHLTDAIYIYEEKVLFKTVYIITTITQRCLKILGMLI